MKSNQMFVLLDLALSQEVFRKTPPYEHVKKVQSFISQKWLYVRIFSNKYRAVITRRGSVKPEVGHQVILYPKERGGEGGNM